MAIDYGPSIHDRTFLGWVFAWFTQTGLFALIFVPGPILWFWQYRLRSRGESNKSLLMLVIFLMIPWALWLLWVILICFAEVYDIFQGPSGGKYR